MYNKLCKAIITLYKYLIFNIHKRYNFQMTYCVQQLSSSMIQLNNLRFYLMSNLLYIHLSIRDGCKICQYASSYYIGLFALSEELAGAFRVWKIYIKSREFTKNMGFVDIRTQKGRDEEFDVENEWQRDSHYYKTTCTMYMYVCVDGWIYIMYIHCRFFSQIYTLSFIWRFFLRVTL